MLGPTAPRAPLRLPSALRALAAVLAVLALLATGVGACDASTSSGLPPITGILIRAETLTSGRGCGAGPTKVFKYAVVVFGFNPARDPGDRASYDVPITSNVFDCFTDGAFVSLPAAAGNTSYRLEVYAYNDAAYASARETIEGAGTNTADLQQRTTPTWTTECVATQQQDVQVLASCDPLLAGLAGLGGDVGATKIGLATARFTLSDGRVAVCATEPEDAGAPVDAAPDGDAAGADADAGEGGAPPPAPAAAPLVFTTVRVRPRVGATPRGPVVDVPCPTAYVAEVGPDPTSYLLDVALLGPSGALVDPAAQTVCEVTSRTGTTSSAVCP